jgi:hypothetical protein
MKMVSNYGNHNNWKQINLQLASFACGLALATIAFIGGGEILRDEGSTQSSSSLTQTESRSIGSVMAEPDFGSVAVDFPALRQPRSIGVIQDEPDFGFTGIEAAPAAVDPHFKTGAESVSAIEGDYLGQGQSSVVESFVIPANSFYPLVQESSHPAAYWASQITDEDFGGVYLPYVQGSEDEVAGATSVSNLNDYLGLGQPGEGTQADRLFSTMADADHDSR